MRASYDAKLKDAMMEYKALKKRIDESKFEKKHGLHKEIEDIKKQLGIVNKAMNQVASSVREDQNAQPQAKAADKAVEEPSKQVKNQDEQPQAKTAEKAVEEPSKQVKNQDEQQQAKVADKTVEKSSEQQKNQDAQRQAKIVADEAIEELYKQAKKLEHYDEDESVNEFCVACKRMAIVASGAIGLYVVAHRVAKYDSETAPMRKEYDAIMQKMQSIIQIRRDNYLPTTELTQAMGFFTSLVRKLTQVQENFLMLASRETRTTYEMKFSNELRKLQDLNFSIEQKAELKEFHALSTRAATLIADQASATYDTTFRDPPVSPGKKEFGELNRAATKLIADQASATHEKGGVPFLPRQDNADTSPPPSPAKTPTASSGSISPLSQLFQEKSGKSGMGEYKGSFDKHIEEMRKLMLDYTILSPAEETCVDQFKVQLDSYQSRSRSPTMDNPAELMKDVVTETIPFVRFRMMAHKIHGLYGDAMEGIINGAYRRVSGDFSSSRINQEYLRLYRRLDETLAESLKQTTVKDNPLVAKAQQLLKGEKKYYDSIVRSQMGPTANKAPGPSG